MRGVFDEDFCDSAAAELRAKRHWVLQGGDAKEGGGYSAMRRQLDLSKPVGNEKYAHSVRKFSSLLHLPVESHNHLRSPSAFKGGSTQLWHLDNGHGLSIAFVAYLTDRVFNYAEVGMGTQEVRYKKGDCALLTSWVWHRGLSNPDDSLAFFAYFDDEHFDVPPPSSAAYRRSQDDNRAGFKLMLSDEEWAELNELHLHDQQPVEYLELDVRADAEAIERLPCMLGKIFKYEADWSPLEL